VHNLEANVETSIIFPEHDPKNPMQVSEEILFDDIPSGKEEDQTYQADNPIFANPCKICTKSFKKPSDLERHKRIHSGLFCLSRPSARLN
jgi:uncharacterized Zn-finger protein